MQMNTILLFIIVIFAPAEASARKRTNMKEYSPKEVEAKWQKIWEEKELFKAVDFDKKPKFYGLIEFPYPSGAGLHVGHIRAFTSMEVISRKRRLQG